MTALGAYSSGRQVVAADQCKAAGEDRRELDKARYWLLLAERHRDI
jgi:hypothetical protein